MNDKMKILSSKKTICRRKKIKSSYYIIYIPAYVYPIHAHVCIVFFFLQDKCFSLMPRTALSRDTPCEERLVSART